MTLPVYIGWDSREVKAYNVCHFSLERHSSIPLEIYPLKHTELRAQGLFSRVWKTNERGFFIDERDGKPFSTEFAFTRFLVPALCRRANKRDGWAMFVDCDFLFLEDIAKLTKILDPKYAIMCVKHLHTPNERIKMDGCEQTQYRRKNWSSLMFFNMEHPANATLDAGMVNFAPGSSLHSFSWLEDSDIGDLPEQWNWLEGHSPLRIKPSAIHYTRGGPWFDNYVAIAYADKWLKESEMAESEAVMTPAMKAALRQGLRE